MFTDEKIFTKNGYFNSKNDVVWADNRSDATERGGLYSKEKCPVSIMVALEAIWYELTRPDIFFNKDNISIMKLIMTSCYRFIKRKVMNCSDTKIGGSNRMGSAVILIKRLSNGVSRTLNSLFRRTDGHVTHLNSTFSMIQSGTIFQST